MRVLMLIAGLLAAGLAGATGSASDGVVTLSVPGMACPVCPITVRKALEGVPGVLAATVDYDSRSARVRFDPARVDVAALRQATADAGYPSEPVAAGGPEQRP